VHSPWRSPPSSAAARSTGGMPAGTIPVAAPRSSITTTRRTDLRLHRRSPHSPAITATSATRCNCSTWRWPPAAVVWSSHFNPPGTIRATLSPHEARSP